MCFSASTALIDSPRGVTADSERAVHDIALESLASDKMTDSIEVDGCMGSLLRL